MEKAPPDILPQQQRENPDPFERSNPVPWTIIAIIALLVCFGIVYIVQANINTPAAWGDGRDRAELTGARKVAGAAIDGGAVFTSRCAACHQATGLGLPGVFPPLAGSEWAQGRDSTVAAIVLYGIDGEIKVKGADFKGSMPPFKDQLDDAQIAAVLTHIRSQWGNTAAPVTAEVVAKAREEHKARSGPFGGEKELPPHE